MFPWFRGSGFWVPGSEVSPPVYRKDFIASAKIKAVTTPIGKNGKTAGYAET
jgi:hypothetical protein